MHKRVVVCTDLVNTMCNVSIYLEGESENSLYLLIQEKESSTEIERNLISMTSFTVSIKARQMESLLIYLFTKRISLPPYSDMPFLSYILKSTELKAGDLYVYSIIISIFKDFLDLLKGMNSYYRWYLTSEYDPMVFYLSMKSFLPVIGEFFRIYNDRPEITGVLRQRISEEIQSGNTYFARKRIDMIFGGKNTFENDIECYKGLIRMTYYHIKSSSKVLTYFRTFMFLLSKSDYAKDVIDSNLISSIV